MLLVVSVLILLLGFPEVKLQRIYEDSDERPMCPCSLNTVDDEPNATFPYPGYFIFGLDYEWLCAATLISDRHLITEAHCVYEYEYLYGVPLSMPTVNLSMKNDLDASILHNYFEKVVIHPGYGNHRSNRDYDYKNDIAIVELTRPVPWVHGIRAAVLPSPRLKLNPGETVSECGWGMLVRDPRHANSTQCVEMSVVDNSECQRILNTSVESNMLCTGGRKSYSFIYGDSACISHSCMEQLPCMSDVGGGLLVRLGDVSVLCGLKSFGRYLNGKCSEEEKLPVGYIRVSSYVDWIYKSTMSAGCKPCIYNRPDPR